MKNILGVIGGLGPMATAYFMRLVTDMTEAKSDQEHIEMVILSRPATPDRTGFILGKSSDSPLPELLKMEDDICALGANIIAMPCITAHYFQNDLVKNLEKYNNVSLIDGINETALYLKNAGIKSCGIMATDGTIQSGLFQKAFQENNIKSIVPDKVNQKNVMDIIYNCVKKGEAVDFAQFEMVSNHLKENGAEVILLGCTELSIAKRDNAMPDGILDVLEVLARKSVMLCGTLKEEYNKLITNN